MAAAQPLDSRGRMAGAVSGALDAAAPLPLERVPIREPLGCGIRAVDAFLTCGRGQRVGFSGAAAWARAR
jgi:flagellum-specific ATP synthase